MLPSPEPPRKLTAQCRPPEGRVQESGQRPPCRHGGGWMARPFLLRCAPPSTCGSSVWIPGVPVPGSVRWLWHRFRRRQCGSQGAAAILETNPQVGTKQPPGHREGLSVQLRGNAGAARPRGRTWAACPLLGLWICCPHLGCAAGAPPAAPPCPAPRTVPPRGRARHTQRACS